MSESSTTDVFGISGTTQAGNLTVERPIAEGGFGVVYRAFHGAFRAPVAMKCLKVPGSLTASERAAFLEKFREEAELLFRLSASIPQVVRPLNVDELHLADGRFVPFIALEWLEGESLASIILRRRRAGKAPIRLPKLIALLSPIAEALFKAHRFPGPDGEIAIIHRDLKPENIFISVVEGREYVRILDYGIAKARAAASSQAGRATADTVHVFTPAYASPEQWVPKRFGMTGPWTDVYGLALTMVEGISGRPPMEGELHTMLASAIDETRRPSPRAMGVFVTDEVEEAFLRALAVDPTKRTQDIATFWTALEDAHGLARTFGSQAPLVRPLSSFPPEGAVRPGPQGETLAAPKLPAGFQDLELDLPVAPPVSSAGRPILAPPSAPSASGAAAGSSSSAAARVAAPMAPLAPAGAMDDWDDAEPSLELDVAVGGFAQGSAPGGGMNVHAVVSRPKPAPNAFVALRAAPKPGASEYWRRLVGPIRILAFALVLTVGDMALRAFGHIALAVGPVTAAWVAAPLAGYAILLAIWRFFSND